MKLKIKYLNKNVPEIKKGSAEAAGFDLYAAIDKNIGIAPHDTVKIPTGIAIALPKNNFGAIYARSGLATKNGLRPANCVGR